MINLINQTSYIKNLYHDSDDYILTLFNISLNTDDYDYNGYYNMNLRGYCKINYCNLKNFSTLKYINSFENYNNPFIRLFSINKDIIGRNFRICNGRDTLSFNLISKIFTLYNIAHNIYHSIEVSL